MTKHNDKPDECATGNVRVLDGQHRAASLAEAVATKQVRVLDNYDATSHVGLRVIVCGAAIERVDESGEETIELPKPRELGNQGHAEGHESHSSRTRQAA